MNGKVFSLFAIFLKIGAFTFGGGYAMIPLIQREVVEKKEWISNEDILDVVAIAESTPGPIAINAATFVGYKVGGAKGALAATFGVVLPSFVIISVLAAVLQQFQDNYVIQWSFFGIRAGVLALIVKALLTMYAQCSKTYLTYLIAVFAFVLVAFFNVNAVFAIIGCAFIGFVTYGAGRKETK